MITSDQGESDCRGYEIPNEELSPRKRPDAEVREQGRQHHEARLEKNCAEDYREHHGRLLH